MRVIDDVDAWHEEEKVDIERARKTRAVPEGAHRDI